MTFTIPMWLVWILAPTLFVALAALSFFAWCGWQFARMFSGGVWR